MWAWIVDKVASPTPPDALSGTASTVEEWPKLRILVLGDSGVGKSCLVERLVTGKPPASNPRWTLGCQISVMTRTIVTNQASEKKVLIEFWDVGGHRNYADTRQIFYHQINGVMLVYDSTNKKSLQHLKSWLDELEREDLARKSRGLTGIEEQRFSGRGGRYSAPGFLNRRPISACAPMGVAQNAVPSASQTTRGSSSLPLDGLPIMIVGNKSDLGRAVPANQGIRGLSMYDSAITSAFASSKDGRPIIEYDKFVTFFDKVYERRYGSG